MAKKQSPVLKWITKKAKTYYKGGKGMKWTAAIKKAGADYRNRKRNGLKVLASYGSKPVGYAPYTRKKMKQVTSVAKKKKRANKKLSNRKAVQSVKIGSVASYMSKGAHMVAEKIGWYEAAKLSAGTLTAKRKIQKKINELKRIYRKLSK